MREVKISPEIIESFKALKNIEAPRKELLEIADNAVLTFRTIQTYYYKWKKSNEDAPKESKEIKCEWVDVPTKTKYDPCKITVIPRDDNDDFDAIKERITNTNNALKGTSGHFKNPKQGNEGVKKQEKEVVPDSKTLATLKDETEKQNQISEVPKTELKGARSNRVYEFGGILKPTDLAGRIMKYKINDTDIIISKFNNTLVSISLNIAAITLEASELNDFIAELQELRKVVNS